MFDKNYVHPKARKHQIDDLFVWGFTTLKREKVNTKEIAFL